MCPNYLVQLVQPVVLKTLVLWQGEGWDETFLSFSFFILSLAFSNRGIGAAYGRTMLCSWLKCKQHVGKCFVNQSAAR